MPLKLEANPNFEEIDCSILPTLEYCNVVSNGWCLWNENAAICESNYNPVLFTYTFDIAVMPRSLISFFTITGAMCMYWISGLIVRKLKIFRHIDSDKLDKCQIYVFELFGLIWALCYVLYAGTYDIIFKANEYGNSDPQSTLVLVRSLSTMVVLLYMYCIEMLTNRLRWSLQLHHVTCMVATTYCMWILDDFCDLAALRCAICLSLYAFTEHNVFAQLLLYRVAPLFSWKLHFCSAVIYVLTRIFATFCFFYCWVQWAATDEIKYQFNGTHKAHYPYLIYFCILPLCNILLNIAQYQTIKALFFVSKSVRSRAKIHHELAKYPRVQALYDIFNEFDHDDDENWDMADFKKFIFYHATFIKHDTCIILWNVLGFTHRTHTVSDLSTAAQLEELVDDSKVKMKKRALMRWKDFKKIFAEHLKSDQFKDHTVKQVIAAQLEVLIHTVFNAQKELVGMQEERDKDRRMSQLYDQVGALVGKKRKSKSDAPSTSPVLQSTTPSIEMYIAPNGTQRKVTEKSDGNEMQSIAENADSAQNENKEEEAEVQLRKVATVAMMNADILRKQLKLNDTMRSMSNGYGAYDEDEQGHDADDALHAMAQSMNMELVLSAPGNIEEQRTV